MKERSKRIASQLGAKVIAQIPEVGGGAFGASRVASLRARLQPQIGLRPGRPTEGSWSVRRKIPMSPATYEKLQQLASQVSNLQRKVSPMQLAAQLLEQSLQE